MPSGNAVWGIDIGQCALKALKLRAVGDDQVEAVHFDVIEHAKILSQPDAEPDELIQAAIEKFVSRNSVQGDQVVIGVPGQQTFARFVKLPPVDPKKIPDMVRFEAGQQIPFDMEDVVWDYQVFAKADSPDVEVGIFAIRKDIIRKQIDFFAKAGLAPTAVQTFPSALYNFCRFDKQSADDGATVVIDVGAQNTDLVVVEPNSAWSRNIPLGGNSFTEALIKSFKLSFSKAESLKKTAATSKYARQIFQAMRPVFAELVAEIQRSIGFYSSTHRDVQLTRVLALGNAFRLPGLQKYLENNLTISGGVVKLEKFNQLAPSAEVNAPQFADNVLSFGTAYGLAVQGLGLAAISASLLPPELARIAVWKKKKTYFMATAACLGLAAALPWTRNLLDEQALAGNDQVRGEIDTIVRQHKELRDQYNKVRSDTSGREESIKQFMGLCKEKLILPRVLALVHEAMPAVAPEIANAKTPEELKKVIESNPGRFARTHRKQMLVEACTIEYVKNIETFEMTPKTGESYQPQTPSGYSEGEGGGRRGMAGGGGSRGGGGSEERTEDKADAPGFYVQVTGRLLYGEDDGTASRLIQDDEYFPRLRELANRPGTGFYIPDPDPKTPTNKETIKLFYIDKFTGTGQAAQEQSSVRSPRGGQPIAPTAGMSAEDALTEQFRDPVTKEDVRSDWRFNVGFKVKLGEKPAVAEEKKD